MINKIDIPPLWSRPKVIEASCFNRVRLALHRLGRPLRIALPGHRGLEITLDDRTWLCVDTLRGDLPVLAWSHFEIQHRAALNEPVTCFVNFYHSHAALVTGSVLTELGEVLERRLFTQPHRNSP